MDTRSIRRTLGYMPERLDDVFYMEYPFESHMHVMMWPTDDGVEGAAQAFAEAIAKCHPSRHNGHGRVHDRNLIDDAYRSALTQCLTRDVNAEYQEVRRSMRAAARWGGPVPDAVLMPNAEDPGGKWDMIVTDDEGEPYMYKMRKGVLDDVVPDVRTMGAKPTELGWKYARNQASRLKRWVNRSG